MKKIPARAKVVWKWAASVAGDFSRNNCPMHAAGLTYFSMLAIVPVLCVLLVAAKALSVADYAERQINAQIDAMIENVERGQDVGFAKFASPDENEREKKRIAAAEFADQARNISGEIFNRVEKFDIGTLGWIGFVFLLWTVISSFGMVEVSFNQIFEVDRARALHLKALMYLAMALFLPLAVAVVFSLPVINVLKDFLSPLAAAAGIAGGVLETTVSCIDSWVFRGVFVFVMSSLVFSFVYWIFPNRKIRYRSCLYGGMIASVLFGGWMKACAVAQIGISKSSALYGSFAFIPIILAWFYMSWQLILLGACMTRSFEKAAGGELK